MSIATQLISINDSKQSIKTAIEGKGVTVGTAPLDQYASKIDAITVSNGPYAWSRPSNWRTVGIPSSEQILGLVEISGNTGQSNFVNFICNGAYTVDWGDGTSNNYASGATAQHDYDYATLDAGFVVDPNRKQVIISITPQAGQTLTVFNPNVRPTTIAASIGSLWVELNISLPNATTLTLGAASTVYHTQLRSINITSLKNSTALTFQNLYSVEQVSMPATWLAPATISNMFNACNALINAPMFDTSASTAMNGMFNGCNSLKYMPLYVTTLNQNFSSFAAGCTALSTLPNFNTPAATNMSSMCSGMNGLITVPQWNTANVTNMGSMFYNCYSLTSVPLFNTSKVTDMGNMFSYCRALRLAPELDFSKVTVTISGYDGLFRDCVSLVRAPESLKNLPATLTAPAALFAGCRALQYIPTFVNTSQWTQIQVNIFNYGMFRDNYALREIPYMNLAGLTSMPEFGTNLYSLERSQATGIKYTHSYANGKMFKPALLEVFTNLGTATAQTLTITNNPAALLNPAVSKTTCGTTAGSTTITQTNTSSLVVGMLVTGTGISTAVAVTLETGANTVTRTDHGLTDGRRVSFATIVTTTGIVVYKHYYVVNATANTFQVALTVGGAPITLTNNGSGTLLYPTYITAITTNTNFTVDVPASATGSVTLIGRDLDTSIATMKGWTVTG